MTDSDVFRDLFHDHDFRGATRALRTVTGGSAYVEARRNLAVRYGFSSKRLPTAADLPAYERTYYPLMALPLPRGHVLDAYEVFKAWSHIIPVAAVPETCIARRRTTMIIVCYVFGPLQEEAARVWRQLLKEYRSR